MANVDFLCEQLASATVEENEKDKEVSFSGRKLKLDTANDALEIVKAIESCPGMITLCLDGNTIGIPAAEAIGKALEKQPNFRNALWKDMFTQRTVAEIPRALAHMSDSIILANAHLVHLDLSDNAFGPRGLIGIVQLLESPSCYTLQELHLNNNGLGISGAKMLAESLCKSVENSQRDGSPLSLKVFVCGRNRLENEGATAVSKFFKFLGSLESVAMPQNGIYHEGIQYLADSFKLNPNLKAINLEDNTLTEEGAKHIAMCLPSLKHINVLNFGDCLIKTQGATVLAEALKTSCDDLRELFLGFNEIGIEGGKAVVEAMRNRDKLKTLVLNGNAFGEEGCEVLKDMMEEYGLMEKFGSLSEDEGEADEDDEVDEDVAEENKVVDVKVEGKEAIEEDKTILPDDLTLAECLDVFMKVCLKLKPGDGAETIETVCSLADKVLTKAVTLCSDNETEFTNQLLVSLRLIKREDEKNAGKIDISGPFMVLPHVIKKAYFPKATRDVLQFFVSRPLTYATVTENSKHGLLQALYQM